MRKGEQRKMREFLSKYLFNKSVQTLRRINWFLLDTGRNLKSRYTLLQFRFGVTCNSIQLQSIKVDVYRYIDYDFSSVSKLKDCLQFLVSTMSKQLF